MSRGGTSYDIPPLLRHFDKWDSELLNDADRDFLLDGILNGFSLIDPTVSIPDIGSAHVPNSFSVRNPDIKPRVEDQIREEIECGNYIIPDTAPRIVSALSIAPKPDNGIRLIHDLSRPIGSSLNTYASKDPCHYNSVRDALNLIQPGWFMAKVDLRAAYRSVHIPRNEYTLTGLSWTFAGDKQATILCDTKLPFGARKSPAIFNRITQAVTRMMSRRGHATIAYLDDFFVCASNFESCVQALNTLITLLRQLGFQMNWKKVVDPCQSLCFLGIIINTVDGTLALHRDKQSELLRLIQTFIHKTRASRRQLESLAGKLCWASQVTPWGRTHTRSVFTLLSPLHEPHHKVRLKNILSDLEWWSFWLENGTNLRRIWQPSQQLQVVTDACPLAGGGFCQGDWFFTHWPSDSPGLMPQHINTKELAAVVTAAYRWRSRWAGNHVTVLTDNSVTAAVINNGTAANITCLYLLKRLAHLALQYGFSIVAQHIPGRTNVLADCISRLHQTGMLHKLSSMLDSTLHPSQLTKNMSRESWCFLFQESTTKHWSNWTKKSHVGELRCSRTQPSQPIPSI